MVRYPQEVIDKAKTLYMQYKNATEIAKETGMTVRAIHHHQQTHWCKEREASKQEFFEIISSNKKTLLLDITDRALHIIAHSLKEIESEKKALNLYEIRAISEILERIDKIVKLDAGQPSEITAAIQPSTIIELKERLKADPFLKIEDADYEESTSVKSNVSQLPDISNINSSSK